MREEPSRNITTTPNTLSGGSIQKQPILGRRNLGVESQHGITRAHIYSPHLPRAAISSSMSCCGPACIPTPSGTRSPGYHVSRPGYQTGAARRAAADRDERRQIRAFGGRIRFTLEQVFALWVAIIVVALLWQYWGSGDKTGLWLGVVGLGLGWKFFKG